MGLTFQWDPRKAKKNVEKHKVSFEEAASVFADPLSMTFPDPDHSVDEMRYITLGHSLRGKLLVVSHTDRENNIRIISARETTPSERHYYEERQ
jgi:hypothetical protein